MTLSFIDGPSDGYSLWCPLLPPFAFFLPTKAPLTASVYVFNSVMPGTLRYRFAGYQILTAPEAEKLFQGQNGSSLACEH